GSHTLHVSTSSSFPPRSRLGAACYRMSARGDMRVRLGTPHAVSQSLFAAEDAASERVRFGLVTAAAAGTTTAATVPASTTPPPPPPASTPPAATVTTATVLARLRLVDGQGPAFNFFPIEGLNSRLGFRITSHLYEPEALGPPRVSVHDDLHGLDRAVRRKEL